MVEVDEEDEENSDRKTNSADIAILIYASPHLAGGSTASTCPPIHPSNFATATGSQPGGRPESGVLQCIIDTYPSSPSIYVDSTEGELPDGDYLPHTYLHLPIKLPTGESAGTNPAID